jgi:CubicO group peptidase (beta-lactamase class C family)
LTEETIMSALPWYLLGLAVVPLLPAPILAGQPPQPAALDAVVREALKSWQVPGAAVAIVHNDRLIYLKGFGVRSLGKNDPVSPDTIFPIASCTRPFTTLALAMLVDDGKLKWDDPVRKQVDYFRLSDPLADADVTLRDLLCHRTGVAGHELLWYRAPWTLEESIRRIGKVPLARPFRSAFQYQSTLFGAAGVAAGKAAGSSWRDVVQRRIIEPLGMKNVSFTTDVALKTSDHAGGHRKIKGKVQGIPWYAIAEPDPSGSLNASARDLAKFVRFQLGDGAWQGRRLASAANLAETHTPQIVIRREGFVRAMNPDTHQLSYGLGWVIQDYRGQLLLMHGGSIDGFRAHFTLVPHARLGIVLLNNLDATQMNLAVSNTLVDLFLDLPPRDWNGYFADVVRADEAYDQARAKTLRARRDPNTKPSRALDAYAGTYRDSAYGTAKVTLEDGKLVWHWSTFKLPLEHFQHDTFLIEDEVLIDVLVTFTVGSAGEVTMKLLDREFKKAM